MDLYVMYLESERQLFFDNNVRFNQIGRRDGLPNKVLDALDRMKQDTAKARRADDDARAELRQPGRDHRRGARDRGERSRGGL